VTIASGTRLGPYEIVAPIGAGGMGEVYRARDTRLDRAVAVKILPAELAANAQFKTRFEREAKTISQLSHPHICTLFDVGENYIVMELLDGESLADRVARGPLPVEETLKYGVQIAEALGRAHRAGIVHRDLKPGNVMLTKSGAKLLDFGLAKSDPHAIDIEGATAHRSLTKEGTIIGTFQYMAPEQLEGQDADPRTDIFALGTVLYEMATGKRAFEGKTKTSLIAAIVSSEPKPVSAIRPLTPPALDHVIKKCLEKDPDLRWQSASDVAEELRWIAEGATAEPKRRAPLSLLIAAIVLALVLGAMIGGFVVARKRPEPPLIYSQINPPEHGTFVFDNSTAVLSPDGSKIALLVKATEGTLVWVRPLDSDTAVPLKGTEGAAFPFWSPDSKSLAFFAGGKLRRISAAGGPPETIADAPVGRGGSWGKGDVIVFTPNPVSGVRRVAASGGEVVRPTIDLDVTTGVSHRFPAFLPDGRHFLAFVQGTVEGGNILLASIDSKEYRLLMRADGNVVFAPPDSILFVNDRTLRVQRIDPKTLQLVGDPKSIVEGVQLSSSLNFVNVSASNNGLLSYVTGPASISALKLFDVHGKEIGTVGTPSDQLDPRLAPDGHAVVATRFDTSGFGDIWSIDLRRSVETRLTFSPANEWAPIWSPDSKSIVYTSFEKSPGDLFVKRVDGSGGGEPLLVDKRRKVASDWTPDGKTIIYQAASLATGGWDIEAYSIAEKKVTPLVHGPANEMAGHLSANGQWLAYTSDASGRMEIYVQHFPPSTEKWQISGGGGLMPAWSHDGRELYYCTPDGKIMAATVHTDHGFVADAPRLLFSTNIRNVAGVTRNQYDVTADGKFLINTLSESQNTTVTLVQNWREKIK